MKSSISGTKYTMRTTTIQTLPFPSRVPYHAEMWNAAFYCAAAA